VKSKKKPPAVGWFPQMLCGVEGVNDVVYQIQGFVAVVGLV
jgi:hypothetical protein